MNRVRILSFSTARETEVLFEGSNTLTYRAKYIFSRLVAQGLSGAYDWGNPAHALRVNAIAIGNGGHLIYRTADGITGDTTTNDVLPKLAGTIQLDPAGVTHDTDRVGMPYIGGTDWGYAGTPDRFVPGPSYEPVENGNVPWDGVTGIIMDNAIGVDEPNTTLYSEIVRVRLDGWPSSVYGNGIKFLSPNAVVFRATLPQVENNDPTPWGYANFNANVLSEIGLVSGLDDFNAYSHAGKTVLDTDGDTVPDVVYIYGKPGVDPYTYEPEKDLYSKAPTVSGGTDTWSGANEWNILARFVFPGIVKGANFSLAFEWVVEF